MRHVGWRLGLAVVIGAITSLMSAGASFAAANPLRGAAAREAAFRAYVRAHGMGNTDGIHTPDDGDLAAQQAQWDYMRTLPGASVSGQALIDAGRAASALPLSGPAWQPLSNKPFNANPSNYTDPFWSNVGSGFSIISGRDTALAETRDGVWFAGTADGGVWRSTNKGQSWVQVFDTMPSLAIGALAVSPTDGSLWVGTGEANFNQDSYSGAGVYRTTNDGASFQRVGDGPGGTNPLVSHTVFNIAFDQFGSAYAATNNGLFRFGAGATHWTLVLAPAGANDNPPYDQQVTSVQVVPHTNGRQVIAAIGFRSHRHDKWNGFYRSTNGGLSFTRLTPTGQIDPKDIGRTTFAYSADGSKLYAIVESPTRFDAGQESVLQGIFSASGKPASVAGPWTKIADEAKLAASGSALAVGSGYGVGIQAWYNQTLSVDPANPNHLYAGLEEIFQSNNGGVSWITASPYWNYGLKCNSQPGGCPNTTHPDQHATMIVDGKIVIGNDGGVYSRPLSDFKQYGGWSDHNATLATYQYYDARAGDLGHGLTGVWGGLQDNGTALTYTGSPQTVEPAGGDGFDVVVDPANARRMVGEYTAGTMYSSTDGGHTFRNAVSPTCAAQKTAGITPRPDCDPAARFITPLAQDTPNKDVWITGGRYVWITKAGWNTTCTDTTCTWAREFDTGAGNAVTAVSSVDSGQVAYAGWVGGGGDPGPAFNRGIVTNYGGTWHQVSTTGLPMRFVAGVTADPGNPAHAYAVFMGYQRHWIPGGGVGHVFETHNGGKTWTNISGNLPDVASDALVLRSGKLALATDLGTYTATVGQGTATKWSRLGSGLPNVAVDDITFGPGPYLYAGTHGRGIWRLPFGS